MSFFSEDRAAELRQLFFESAQELLQTLNEDALKLEKNSQDPELARAIRRTIHTIKGDSAACGFRELSELAHELEDALAPEVTSAVPSQVAELVLSAADVFEAMLAAYKGKLQLPAAEPLQQMIRGLRPSKSQAPRAASIPPPVTSWTEGERQAIAHFLRAGKNVFRVSAFIDPQCPMRSAARQLLQNVLQQCGELLALHPDALVTDATLVEAALVSDNSAEWIAARCRIPAVTSEIKVETWPAVRQIIAKHQETNSTARTTAAEAAPAAPGGVHTLENSLRVDADRIDHVLNLIGELIIGKSMLQQTVNDFSRRFPDDVLRNKFADVMAYQTRVLNDLQRSAMQVRMVPVEQLFRRFPRIVRDLGKQCGKEIGLMLSGQDTELDKSILDAIAEPLAHLVRNAADHGLETAEARQKAGKAAKGTIRLNAYHQGNQVVIEVSDDGRGIDTKKVLRKAIERGILTTEEAAKLSDQEVAMLIFRPGFSTAEEVTEISGRGIGMDIVQNVIHRLKGTVSIESQAGAGTRFLLKVPLTLAIIKALLFRVGGRLYAIPLNSVVEITRAVEADIHRVDNHEVLQLRKIVLTMVRLGRRTTSDTTKMFVMVVTVGERKYGLVVDELVGEEELVIKPLDQQVVSTELVSGASILGDGTVVLILNLAAVVERYIRIRPPSPGAALPGVLTERAPVPTSATGDPS